MKNKKILILGTTILAILIIIVGVSLAIFTYSSIGSNQELVLGDIYMHYNEGNGIALTDAMPYQIKDIVNPVMTSQTYEEDTRNELSKCVDSFSDWDFNEGEDPESFCKGTGTNYGDTFQKGIDEAVISDYEYEFLTSNNIIVSDYYNLSYFEFTISGKNTYTEKDIWYDISLIYGDNHETRNTRIRDNLLKFTLVEIKDGVETIVVDNQSYSSLDNKRIYVNTIEKNTTSEVNITYRLYMWIDYNTVIGNVNQDYTMKEWKDVFASIKVKVTGDVEEKYIETDASCFETKVYGEGVAITDYDASCGSDVVIPKKINGKEVVSISTSGFSFGAFFDKQLTSVVIPDSVVIIESNVFSNNQLTSIVIPNSVIYIYNNAFYNNQLTSVEFEENSNLLEINSNAFTGNNISEVYIPESVKKMDCTRAFDDNVIIHKSDNITCGCYGCAV